MAAKWPQNGLKVASKWPQSGSKMSHWIGAENGHYLVVWFRSTQSIVLGIPSELPERLSRGTEAKRNSQRRGSFREVFVP